MSDEKKDRLIKIWLCPGCDLIHIGIFNLEHSMLASADLGKEDALQIASKLQELSKGH